MFLEKVGEMGGGGGSRLPDAKCQMKRAIHLLLELGFAILASGDFFKIGKRN